ncbi:Bromodomain-containing protein [Dioscorea alata]|uniref:Bromodomain-containing protein n=1 Tax=Dioscorea alata TaxID=55571 RepID=A0ACB7WMX1_DIOAL|nr:Bromodomain-containing protein [Dioscorea alata]
MARSGDPDEGEGEIWGTWEELLLASAVSRHGTRRWDSVAMEVQSRIPASSAHLLTPLRCRQRFHLLQNRFSTATVAVTDGEPDGEPLPDIPWLEDLRKLRVAELRREVERSDLSIRNLQIKVERLKGERERIAGEAEHGGGEADLKSGEGRKGSGGSTPETLAGDRISGRSCKESNSTDPKEDGRKPGEDAENAKDTAGDGKRKMDPVAGERSDDRSSAAGDPDPADPRESGESAAESKGGEAEERERDGEKESSEVQSSASLTRRRRMGRRRKAPSVSSSGAAAAEEPETDVVSPHAASVPSTASQPLVSFLEIIRSSKPGSVFARRLDSQKTAKYKSLIRRHVDLEMVTRRIGRSGGAYTSLEFFRDLLLLCNNAIVFYAKSSDEAIAAVHLRDLISKEMTATGKQKPDEAPPAPPPPLVQPPPAAKAPPPQPAKLKEDPDLARSLLEKSTSAAPLITCRKRSSISAKKADPDRKEEKPEPDRKERDAEDPIPKKKTKERSSFPPARGFRTNKMRALPKNSNPDSASNLNAQVAEAAEADSTPKVEKKNTPNGGSAASLSKKRSATSFLNRMKRSSPSNGTLLESLKSSGAAASSGGKTTDQKKSGKGESRKEQGSKSGATAKQTPEPSAPTKRSVGRPPKRGAAPPSKRAREEAEGSKPTPPARKRGRR